MQEQADWNIRRNFLQHKYAGVFHIAYSLFNRAFRVVYAADGIVQQVDGKSELYGVHCLKKYAVIRCKAAQIHRLYAEGGKVAGKTGRR